MPIYLDMTSLYVDLIAALIGALPVLVCLIGRCAAKFFDEYLWSAIELWEFGRGGIFPSEGL